MGDRKEAGWEDPGTRIHDEEDVEEFFGQLWVIPKSEKVRVPPRHPLLDRGGALFWVRRDLVRERNFKPEDCFPVGRADRIDQPATKLSFSRDIWASSSNRSSYADVLKNQSMAEQGGRWIWQPDPPRPRRPQGPRQPPPRQQQ